MLRRGLAPNGKRLLSESGFAELVKPQMTVVPKVMDYGLGWFIQKWHGLTVVEHGGNIDGFNAEVALLPQNNLGFVLLTNVTASPLAQKSLDIVWSNLVDLPPNQKPDAAVVADIGPVVASKEEAGTYLISGSPAPLTVAYAENKLTLSVPGQPTYPLERLSGRRYKLGAPAPDGFFITFRPVKDKPSETEASLEQPNGIFPLTKKTAAPSAAFVSPILVENLLAKMIKAVGGEATLRRHKTLSIKSRATLENQGLTAQIETVTAYPNRREQKIRLIALGTKEVARTRNYFDGFSGGYESNYGRNTEYDGDSLYNTALQSYLQPILDARKIFPKLEITGTQTGSGEEVLVLKKTPVLGDPITEYVSLKTFLVVRRDFSASSQLYTERYEDYRFVDGEKIPFKITTTSAALGPQRETVLEATFDVPVSASAFAPLSSGKETARHAQK